MLIVLLPLGVWVVVIVAMRSEGVDPKSMEGVLGDRAYHLAADHHIHHKKKRMSMTYYVMVVLDGR